MRQWFATLAVLIAALLTLAAMALAVRLIFELIGVWG
jgi:hypothetical protein